MEQRFWSKVNKTETCWLWTASTKNGYGRFMVDKKGWPAHRYSYTITNGEIPEALVVRHTCDNPPCVNPSHLLVGTNKENSADMIERNRHPRLKGEKHGRSKLTNDDVHEIRILRGFDFTYKELAKMYSVTFASIGRILNKRSWDHI